MGLAAGTRLVGGQGPHHVMNLAIEKKINNTKKNEFAKQPEIYVASKKNH